MPATFIIVADKFADFAINAQTITLSQLKALMALPTHLLQDRNRLLPGQGLSDDDCSEIVTLVENSRGHEDRWDITGLKALPSRAEAKLSHKRKPCNTLIGTPRTDGLDQYRIDLCIDEACEMMDDHQTGQHVQGMVLVEAARQAFLAVTEKFFLQGMNHKSYFVINDMQTRFLGFVFPLAAHMIYRIVDKDINLRRQKFQVEIDLVQGSEVRASTRFGFTAYPEEVISAKEAELAMVATAQVLKTVQPQHVA
ncbi:AfsA-related hotdog domain-containing protein [Rhodovulum imhoffii]|nr:AfsA-related hotdog domain-containing protein [Rhodovulum imhoffii]